MAIEIQTEVWAHAPLAGAELLIALALADSAGADNRQCWPGVTLLADRARCSEQWVRKVLRRLESIGMLKVEQRPGRSSVYELTPRDQWPAREAREGNPRGGGESEFRPLRRGV